MKAMFVLYCIGIAFAGLAFLGAIAAFFTDGRVEAVVDAMLCFVSVVLPLVWWCFANDLQLAFLALAIASAIASALIVKAVNAINYYGNDVGIAAYKGSSFLALTWVATVLMFLAAVGWLVDCCVGSSRRKKSYV